MARLATGGAFPTPQAAYDREDEAQFRAAVSRQIATLSALQTGGVFVNVRDAPYSARGNGVADDTGAFENAITFVAAAGGGIVYVPRGTYMVTGIRLRTRVELMGEGWCSEIKQIAPTHTVDVTGTATAGTATTLTDSAKSWTVNEHQWKSVAITSGTGSGQVRMILSNTATALTIGMETAVGSEDWATNPDATSVYSILTPTPIVGLFDGDVEMTVVRSLKLEGNGGSQLAHNPGIYWDNEGGTFTIGDANHRAEYLWINNTNGSGIIKGPSTRETFCTRVTVRLAGRHSIITEPGGGTDNRNLHCISQASRFSGFVANGSNEHWIGCKSFGSGDHTTLTGVSGNRSGFLIQEFGKMIVGCESQENVEHGFHLVGAENTMLIGRAGANGNDGVRLFDAVSNRIILQAKGDEGVPTGRIQDYAVSSGGGTNSNNMIDVTTDDTHATGTVNANLEGDDNDIRVNNRWKGQHYSQYGAVGAAHIHHAWGKGTSPAADDPQFGWKTSDDDPVIAQLFSFDGSDTLTYVEIDHDNAIINLGSGDTVPRVPTYSDATRPAAGNPGVIIMNSDDSNLNIDTGAGWILPDGTAT